MELVKKNKISKDQRDKIINEFENSPFTTDNIIKEIKKINDVYEYVYKTKWVPNSKFHFITNVRSIKKIVEYYFFVIEWKQKINPSQFLEDVFIYIFPTHLEKKLKKVPTPNDVNSGATTVYYHYCGGPIYIWRKQELLKVLVHEALHSVHYDLSIFSKPYKIFKGMPSLHLNECYNEFGTIYMMALKKNKNNVLYYIKKQLQLDKENISLLMKKNKLKKLEDFLDKKKYKQEASIFSYIVLKGLMIETLLKNCDEKGIKDFWKLGFYQGIDKGYQSLLLKIFENYKKQTFHFENKKKKFMFSIF